MENIDAVRAELAPSVPKGRALAQAYVASFIEEAKVAPAKDKG
jgi:hypothetical protein